MSNDFTPDFQVTVSGLKPNTNAASATGDSGYMNYKGWAKTQWTNGNGQEFYYAEAHSFINPASNSLAKRQITVTHNGGVKPIQMWLSCGNQSVMMTETPQGGVWTWTLDQKCSQSQGGGQISKYLEYLQNYNSEYQGVVQMTLQPYDHQSKSNGNCDQGFRSVLLCFGPQDYGHSSTNIIKASELKPANYQLGDQNFWVGGLAQYFIESNKDYQGNYVLIIDQEIDEMGALSCAVAYSKGNDTYRGAIDLAGKWTVTGTHRINGYKAYEKYNKDWSNEAQRFVCTGLLDISTCSQQNPCIDVCGVTFAYPGHRNESSIKLNCLSRVDWYGDTTKERYKTIKDNLLNGRYKTPNENFQPIHVFDTKMIGGWVDASDGIETFAPNSYFDRNFMHINDDSIKIFTNHIRFNNTTLWQGNAGAAIAPAAYGYVNGPITDSQVNGVFVHRVTHKFDNNRAQDDDMGGLISNRVCFNDDYFHEKNDIYMGSLTINNLYVPSLENIHKSDVNSISRVIVLSAINPGSDTTKGNPTDRLHFYKRPTSKNVLKNAYIQGIKLENVNVNLPYSYDHDKGYSQGMYCVGDYVYGPLNKDFSGNIPYADKDGNNFTVHLYIDKVLY